MTTNNHSANTRALLEMNLDRFETMRYSVTDDDMQHAFHCFLEAATEDGVVDDELTERATRAVDDMHTGLLIHQRLGEAWNKQGLPSGDQMTYTLGLVGILAHPDSDDYRDLQPKLVRLARQPVTPQAARHAASLLARCPYPKQNLDDGGPLPDGWFPNEVD